MTARGDGRITENDRKIYKVICTHWQKNHKPLTLREVGMLVGDNSPSHVRYCVLKLVKKGLLEYEQNQARSVRPVHAAGLSGNWYPGANRLPVIGRIVAGDPIPVPDSDFSAFDSEFTIDLGSGELPAPLEQLFALQVKGDSMKDAMVNDGDIVVMMSVSEVRNGQMVAAWLKQDGETTLKRFYQEGSLVRLQPENRDYAPIIRPAEDVVVQGVVVRLIRDYELN